MDRTKLTQAELGRLLGISQPMVSKLATWGMPVDSVVAAKAWRAQYLDTRLTVDYRPQRRRAPRSSNGSKACAPVDDKPADWRDRHDRAKALLAERQLALLEGRSLDAGQAGATWTKGIANMRQRLLSIPNKVAARIPDAAMRARVHDMVEAEIHQALLEISDGA